MLICAQSRVSSAVSDSLHVRIQADQTHFIIYFKTPYLKFYLLEFIAVGRFLNCCLHVPSTIHPSYTFLYEKKIIFYIQLENIYSVKSGSEMLFLSLFLLFDFFLRAGCCQLYFSLGEGSVGRGGGEGGVGDGNLGVIFVRVCEPVFQNLPHLYTWPLKKRTIHIFDHPKCWPIHILPFDFLYPSFAGC